MRGDNLDAAAVHAAQLIMHALGEIPFPNAEEATIRYFRVLSCMALKRLPNDKVFGSRACGRPTYFECPSYQLPIVRPGKESHRSVARYLLDCLQP